MKKLTCFLLSLILVLSLSACGKDNDTDVMELPSFTTIYPLPFEDLSTLEDATLQCALYEDSLVTDAGVFSLTVDVYEEVLYDAVEVSQLMAGMIFVDEAGKETTIESVEEDNGAVLINRGVDYGGFTLYAAEGGTYRLMGLTEYGDMVKVGRMNYPIADDCVITDNADLENPGVIIAIEDFESVLKGEMNNFNCYNTLVTLEEGNVTEITRNYMP